MQPPENDPISQQAEAQAEEGTRLQEQGLDARARTCFKASLQLYAEIGDKAGQAKSLLRLAVIARDIGGEEGEGAFDQMGRLAADAGKLYQELDDKPGMAACLRLLSVFNPKRKEMLEQSLAYCEEAGDTLGTAHTLGWLASTPGASNGDELREQALTLMRTMDHPSALAGQLFSTGINDFASGRMELANVHLKEALEIYRTVSNHKRAVMILQLMAYVSAKAEDGKQEEFYREAIAESRLANDTEREASCYLNLMRLARKRKDKPAIAALQEESRHLESEIKRLQEEADRIAQSMKRPKKTRSK